MVFLVSGERRGASVCRTFANKLKKVTLTGRKGDHTVGTRGPRKRGNENNVTTDRLKPSEGKDPYLESVRPKAIMALTRVRKPKRVGRV